MLHCRTVSNSPVGGIDGGIEKNDWGYRQCRNRPAIEGEYLPAKRGKQRVARKTVEPPARRQKDRLTDVECRTADARKAAYRQPVTEFELVVPPGWELQVPPNDPEGKP